MKLSDIKKYFNNKISLHELKTVISFELNEYKQGFRKVGSSIPIKIDGDCTFDFKNEHLVLLCQLYINEQLCVYEVSYISDALLLSPQVFFQNELMEDVLESFCVTSENNKRLSTDKIIELIKEIDSNISS